MKDIFNRHRQLFINTIIFVVISGMPLIGLIGIPLLFLVNLILGIVHFNKNRELAIIYFILAIVTPLIGLSICSVSYTFFNF